MRNLARVLLVLGLAALGLLAFRGAPRDVTLIYALPDPAGITSLEVDVLRGDAALRHVELRFPGGAPGQVRHDVRLPDGDYRLLLRMSGPSGPPRRATLPLTVAGSGPVVLPVPAAAPPVH